MFIKYYFKHESGVTLIELLTVISIISVLVGGLLFVINPAGQKGKANDAKRKSDLAQIQRALEMYYQDNGRYPTSTVGNLISGISWGAAWSPYMSTLPADPVSPRTYVYYTPNTGASCSNYQCYYLYANLERTNDPQGCTQGTGGPCAQAAANGLVCGGASYQCIYGVSSSNVTP